MGQLTEEVTERDNVPYDIIPLANTVVIRRDPTLNPDVCVTPFERELLRLLTEHWGAYERHYYSGGSRTQQLLDWGFMQGLLAALDATAETVDARIQLAIWTDKLRG